MKEIEDVILAAKELIEMFPLSIRRRAEMVAKICAEENKSTDFSIGVAWADYHPNWISVKDALPPYDEMVLLYCDSWDIPHVCGRAEGCDSDVYYNDEGRMLEDKPSYWMPLPKTPKIGEKEEEEEE
jgi:hypothetical protein